MKYIVIVSVTLMMVMLVIYIVVLNSFPKLQNCEYIGKGFDSYVYKRAITKNNLNEFCSELNMKEYELPCIRNNDWTWSDRRDVINWHIFNCGILSTEMRIWIDFYANADANAEYRLRKKAEKLKDGERYIYYERRVYIPIFNYWFRI